MYQGLRNAVVKPLELDGALLGHLITDAKHELELFQHDLNISDLLGDVGGVARSRSQTSARMRRRGTTTQ